MIEDDARASDAPVVPEELRAIGIDDVGREPSEKSTTRFRWVIPAYLTTLGVILIVSYAVLCALPVRDSDLWWQMAYGRHLLTHHTLVPDHTIFSWTPADGTAIYCAWIAEILLYLIFMAGGLPLLFAFRYFCFALFLAALGFFAWKHRLLRHPLAWFVALLSLLMGHSAAAFLKPEIFSFVLMTLTVSVWVWVKSASPEEPWKLCYLLPLLMLVWVNSHGGFVFGMGFLFLLYFGETMNALLSPRQALSPRLRRHLFIAIALSGMCTLITPYGPKYLHHLVSTFAAGDDNLKTVFAYVSVFSIVGREMHLHELGIIGLVILLALFIPHCRARQIDWSLLLVNLCFSIFFTFFARVSYFWAIIVGFSILYLLTFKSSWVWRQRRMMAASLAAVILFSSLLLSGRALKEHLYRPPAAAWPGFSAGYQNPVEEAEYIESYLRQVERIGNDYTSGGYLLWKLGPEQKIMIDARYFPFKSWYSRYRAFATGRDISRFVRAYPADVWCINFRYQQPIRWFTSSPDFKLAFYGARAAIFVRREMKLPEGAPLRGKEISDIRDREFRRRLRLSE